jgi:hypothetical protein
VTPTEPRTDPIPVDDPRRPDEEHFAVALAKDWLDRPGIDPDGDKAVLSRQFLRVLDRLAAAESQREAWATWIVDHAPLRHRDWACAECDAEYPHEIRSDMLIDGFRCIPHQARAALASPGEEKK